MRLQERRLKPVSLYFLKSTGSSPQDHPHYERMDVDDWRAQNPGAKEPTYCFISYTAAQFPTASAEIMSTWRSAEGQPLAPEEITQRARLAQPNHQLLERFGAHAAQRMDVDAFWIDFCVSPVKNGGNDVLGASQSEAWNICDIVRQAHSMVILRGPGYEYRSSPRKSLENHESKQKQLAQWGGRLWTLPELLFCPNRSINVYRASDVKDIDNGRNMEPDTMTKLSIAEMLEDGYRVRELVDHYEGTIQLSPLELVSLAAECLFQRPFASKNPGDQSYALMGLMRRRPEVNVNDSAFKAFARLSLANDSDRLLERLVCMQPDGRKGTENRCKDPLCGGRCKEAHWYEMTDDYGAKLWDIEPCCQVAGIIDAKSTAVRQIRPDTDNSPTVSPSEVQMVTLDGASGAAIQWDTLQFVAFTKRPTSGRKLARLLVRLLPIYFVVGVVLMIPGGVFQRRYKKDKAAEKDTYDEQATYEAFNTPGSIFLGICLVLMVILPELLWALYGGDMWFTQASFFGMQGIPDDLSQIEKCLFGLDCARLRWSTHGSPLSRSKRHEDGELGAQKPEPVDPLPDGKNVYTIIDTFTLEATAFYADRPPTAVIICGQEGGMQRALLCSYDPFQRAFCRETVLRMKTICLERMSRMDRFRFALRRP